MINLFYAKDKCKKKNCLQQIIFWTTILGNLFAYNE
jgi:hypothetical protein